MAQDSADELVFYTWDDDVEAQSLAVAVDPNWVGATLQYFVMEGIDYDSCNYDELYLSVFDWLETPYKYAGRTKNGVDCSSLVKALYSEAYNLQLSGSSRDLYAQCEPVDFENLQEGDLVFFKINKSVISHVGLYLSDYKFVHASTVSGVTVADLRDDYYVKYFYDAGRIAPANYTADEAE